MYRYRQRYQDEQLSMRGMQSTINHLTGNSVELRKSKTTGKKRNEMEDSAMLSSEIVVGLWFVPVVLCIIIPLSILCLWSIHKLMRTITDRIEQTQRSAKEFHNESPVSNVRPRHAV